MSEGKEMVHPGTEAQYGDGREDAPTKEAILTFIQRAYITGRSHQRQHSNLIVFPDRPSISGEEWIREIAEQQLFGAPLQSVPAQSLHPSREDQ